MSKFRNLTPQQVIMAMVEGLKNPKTIINMGSYGEIKYGECIGCAATNAICHIYNIDDPSEYFFTDDEPGFAATKLNQLESLNDIDYFEMAINELRQGGINNCNRRLSILGISPIIFSSELISRLVTLTDENYKDNLQPYIDLANYQNE